MATKLGKYLEERKQIKAAKKQYGEDSTSYATLFKEAVPIAGRLPEKDRKAGQGQLQEFHDRLQNLKLVTDVQQRAKDMRTLLGDLQQWKVSKVGDPSKPTVPTTPPTTTTAPTTEELKNDLEALHRTLTKAQLTLPPFVKATTDEKIKGVLAAKGELVSFAEQWLSSERVEKEADDKTKELKPPTKAFESVHKAWLAERTKAQEAWDKLSDAKGAGAPGQILYGAAVTARSAREELQRLQTDGAQKLQQADQRVLELSKSRLFDITAGAKRLGEARLAFTDAADKGALENAIKLIEGAAKALDNAVSTASGPKVEALNAYNKLRAKVEEELAKCGKLRGATVEGSKVELKIKELKQKLIDADTALSKALVSSQVNDAAQLLKDALALKTYDQAKKLAETIKKETESDLKALPEYQTKFEALLQARARVSQIAGAHEQLQLLDALIAKVRVDGSGRPPGGFEKALTEIKNGKVDALEKQAEQVGKNFTTKQLPQETQTKFTAVEKALTEFAKLHTEFEVIQQRRALALAVALDDPKAALEKLKLDLDAAVKSRGEEKTKLDKALDELKLLIEALPKHGMLDADPRLVGLRNSATSIALAVKEFRVPDAQRELTAANEIAQALTVAFDKATLDWNTVQKSLAELRKRAEPLQKSPQMAYAAVSNVSSIDRLLENVKDKSIDLEEAVRRGNRVLAGETEFNNAIEQAGLGGRDNEQLKTLGVESERLQKLWNAAVAKAGETLKLLDEPLKTAGAKGGIASTPWPARLAELGSMHASKLKSLKLKPGEDIAKALQTIHDDLMKELKLFTDGLPDPKAPTAQAFVEASNGAKQKELLDTWRNDYNSARQLLAEAELLGGKALPTEKGLLGEFDAGKAKAADGKRWADLKLALAKKVVDLRREANLQKAPARQQATLLKNRIGKKLLDRQSVTFRGLFDDLTKRLDDALAMLDTDDATLIEAANRQIAEIQLTIDESKGKGDKGAITLEQVQKRWADLSHVLGDGAVVSDRLPATYGRLKRELDAAVELAKRSPPDQGMAALEKLQQPIMDARKSAKLMQQRYEGYKLRREQLQAQLDKVKDHTGTTLGNRMTAYNERFAARVGEANALAKQEGQMDAAYKALADLENELAELLKMAPDAARVKLQTLNAEAETEQRELRDMARNWNAAQAYWEDTLLPAVDKAVAARGDDDTEAQSLRASVGTVGKTLQPYLDVISMLPHKRAGANGAPEMKAARAAFSQAFTRLAQVQKVAQRLRDGGGSTNVDLERDLKALEQDWQRRVTGARDAMVQLASFFNNLSARIPKDTTSPDHLNEGEKQSLEGAAKQIESLLSRLADRFRADAFTDVFNTLGADKPMPEKRKARETAIRAVHQLAADIAKNPLFNSVYDGTNRGLIDVDVRPQLSLLRAGLKKIELAVLVGI